MQVKIHIDELNYTFWGFHIFENTNIVLNEYGTSTKQSKRHGEKVTTLYSRLNTRDKKIQDVTLVPFPNEVKEKIKQQIFDSLKVYTWQEYKNR